MSREPDILDTGEERPETVVLIPDGTLCFCRPIVNAEGHFVGFETVWLKPNEAGVWEAVGDVSKHVYRHVSWYEDRLMAEGQMRAQALAIQEHMRRLSSRRYRAKIWLVRKLWALRVWLSRAVD